MSYYFEVWLRGYVKDYFRSISGQREEAYHPHITFNRPFGIVGSEEKVRDNVASFCNDVDPIPFYLEGRGNFDERSYYVPVFENGKLMRFNNGLKEILMGDVEFVKELNPEKIFHVNVDFVEREFCCPRIYQHMLRLTGICDKKIWFSYDFVTGEILNREESLDNERWEESVDLFGRRCGNEGLIKVASSF